MEVAPNHPSHLDRFSLESRDFGVYPVYSKFMSSPHIIAVKAENGIAIKFTRIRLPISLIHAKKVSSSHKVPASIFKYHLRLENPCIPKRQIIDEQRHQACPTSMDGFNGKITETLNICWGKP